MTCDPQRATCKLDPPKKKNHGPFGEATILATNNRSIEPRCEVSVGSTGAFCLRVRDFEISYERIRWPAISRNQNNGGLRGEKFRVRVVICVVYLPCLRCRRCQKIEKRLGCLWQKVTAKYFRIIRGNQVVLVWNSHVVSNLAKVA